MQKVPKFLQIAVPVLVVLVALYGGSWVWWWSCVSSAQDCNNKKQWEQAEPKLLQAAEIAKPFSWVDFRYTASRWMLASTYVLEGEQSKAEPIFAEVAAQYDGPNKPAFPKEVQVLIGYGSVYVSQYKPAQAVPIFQKALDVLQRDKEVQSKDGANVVHMLAKLHRDQGLTKEAVPLFERSMEIRRTVYGANSPEVITAMYDLGFDYYVGGDYEEAAEIFSEALAMAQPKQAWAARNALAACYIQMGEKDRGLKLLKESAAKIPPEIEHPSLTYTLGRLTRIFAEQGKFELASRFFKQAEAINHDMGQTKDADFQEAAHIYADRLSIK